MAASSPHELRRRAPVAWILRRAADLLRDPGSMRAAAADIDDLLAAQPITIVPALDRAFRDPDLHHTLGLRFLDLRPPDVARLEHAGAATSGALGIASLVRDGHAREAAVRGLADRSDRVATAFLLNRLNDYVLALGDLAWAALLPRLVPRHAEGLVGCLPLIERMSVWVRAAVDRRRRLAEFVRGPQLRPVLMDSLHARDRELVRAACNVLLDLYRGQPEIGAVLAAALARGDQALRRRAAVLAVDPAITPVAVRKALASRLEADRDPAVRAAAVRGHAAQGDRQALLRAAFDPHGLVRHHARLRLAGGHESVDYRGRALATLAEPQATRAALVGALATLSEFGRRPDIPVVAAFIADPRPSIAREAARTLALLERLP